MDAPGLLTGDAAAASPPACARDFRDASVSQFKTSFGPARVVPSTAHLDPETWKRAFAGQCKDYRYYEVAAETLRHQFDHRFLILENSHTGGVAIQPLFFVRQDLTAGMPGKVRSLVN